MPRTQEDNAELERIVQKLIEENEELEVLSHARELK